jgi:hypothetical protein
MYKDNVSLSNSIPQKEPPTTRYSRGSLTVGMKSFKPVLLTERQLLI